MEQLTMDYASRIKDHIRKARKHHLKCTREDSAEQLIGICQENGLLSDKTSGVFRKLWIQLMSRGIGFCLYAKDEDGNIHCGGAFIRDREKLIFLALSTKKEYKKLGSTAFLIHESIRIAYEQGYSYFDFEGSMLETVEHFFKGFNPSPIIYFNVKKNKMGNVFHLYEKIRGYFRATAY
jgi:GNAT superfamily N-acetyltransferase